MSDASVITPDRFIEKGPMDCWLWQGQRNGDDLKRGVVAGYGAFMDGRCVRYVHRTLYEELVGPIPKGWEIDHLCRVHACCNPGHLEAVTHAENQRRGRNTRLERSDVVAIRASKESHKDLAERYGVHASHILRIRSREKWADV